MKHKFLALTSKSFDELGVSNYKDLWTKAQEEGYTALQLGFVTTFTKAEDADNKFHAVLSDSLEDRHGDIVVQEWVLTNFKKNSVLLDSHDYSSIEKIIGRWTKIAVKEGKLQGDIEFALSNPRGLLAYNLAKDGFLTALSAGFIPMEFGEKGEIMKSELLEGSMVSIPANPRTLIEKSIVTEEVKEEVKEPKEEVKAADPIIEEKRKSLLIAISERMKSQDRILKAVASEMKGATPENINERKRRIWKALREAI